MLSNKAKYGLHATFLLAKEFGNGPLLIAEIAEREQIPKKFLELILLDLKRHGVLHSKMGKGGGYMLAKSPDKISVGQVIRILDGPLALTTCVSKTAYKKCAECKNERSCEIKKLFQNIRDNTSQILDGTTLSSAMKSKKLFFK